LSAELRIAIDAQVEAPGHGKWWLDGKTGSDKRYIQQCMCSIVTPEEEDNDKKMSNTKWIESNGVLVAVSPAAECVCMLSNPSRINGIKSEGMRAKREAKALVEMNDYATYSMVDVPIIPDFKIIFPKGKFNGVHAYYNIRTDPDLGVGWAALCRVACGCQPCKDQLVLPWMKGVDMSEQPRYAENRDCLLWLSYEGANNWRISELVPRTDEDKRGARKGMKCVLDALEARISRMVRKGDVGAIGTTDEEAMGYYVVKWLSEPYTLQNPTEGMSGVIGAGVMVADALYFNRVKRAPYWYTVSGTTTVVEVRYALKTGLKLETIDDDNNKLPQTCNQKEATRQNAVRVTLLDHEEIMEEAGRRDRLEYDAEEETKDEDEDEDDGESESGDESDE
jgi:hypothetical protein